MDNRCPVCQADIGNREDKGSLVIKFLFGEVSYKDFDPSEKCPLCSSKPGERIFNS